MTERPILFSDAMVRAILEGRKTQTRRLFAPKVVEFFDSEDAVVRWGDAGHSGPGWYVWSGEYPDEGAASVRCPYGGPGDRLWVREAWRLRDFQHVDGVFSAAVEARADGASVGRKFGGEELMNERCGWRPSIYMPRWASRISLEVTGVRVERLQDISEEDAIAEGVGDDWYAKWVSARAAYAALWDSINGERASWASNPWVWVVEFKRVTP